MGIDDLSRDNLAYPKLPCAEAPALLMQLTVGDLTKAESIPLQCVPLSTFQTQFGLPIVDVDGTATVPLPANGVIVINSKGNLTEATMGTVNEKFVYGKATHDGPLIIADPSLMTIVRKMADKLYSVTAIQVRS